MLLDFDSKRLRECEGYICSDLLNDLNGEVAWLNIETRVGEVNRSRIFVAVGDLMLTGFDVSIAKGCDLVAVCFREESDVSLKDA